MSVLPIATGTRSSGDLDRILRELKKVRRSGQGYLACCPVHDDSSPSLSLKEAADGRLLVHCHAGCDQRDVLAALGIAGRHGAASQTRDKQRTATYEYTDAQGRVVFYRERYEWFAGGKRQKSVLPRQLDGSRKGTPPVPYRLHEVVAAIEAGTTIVLVEGEKAADALRAHGYVATTTGAATSWRPEFANYFGGARIVLWPDADAPGERYVAEAARDLAGVAAELCVLRIGGKSEGWDAADFFAEGGSDSQLDQLLSEALPWVLTDPLPTTASDEPSSQPRRFRLLTVADLEALPEPEPLVEGVLFRGTTAGIIAPYASFKSFVALDMALSIATGLDWHGRAVRQGAVVYVVAEGAFGMRRRVEAWRQLNRLPDVGGIYFLPQSVVINDARDSAEFLRALSELPHQPVVVFVDTMARTLRGNENSQEDTSTYVSACDRIRETTGATVVLVHHTGWEATRSRGSSNIPASLDTELTLKREGDEVTIRATKQKDAPDGVDIITLKTVQIAGSLALQVREPLSPVLSQREHAALASVQGDGLTHNEWVEAINIAKSSLKPIRERLQALGYVRHEGKRYRATDAGCLALGSGFRGGSAKVHEPQAPEVQPPPIPRRMGAEPGACPSHLSEVA